MLTKPHNGWSDFSIGYQTYTLSYLTELPLDWLKQAIRGLELMLPFSVHGYCEPGRMLCTVSYWNCHIILEDDDKYELNKEDTEWSIEHIGMLQFCKDLYNDIYSNIDEWIIWLMESDSNIDMLGYDRLHSKISKLLDRLQSLIKEKEHIFEECVFF